MSKKVPMRMNRMAGKLWTELQAFLPISEVFVGICEAGLKKKPAGVGEFLPRKAELR
jgi:hypothetical protein